MTAAWITHMFAINPETGLSEPVELCNVCGVAKDAIADVSLHVFWHSRDGLI